MKTLDDLKRLREQLQADIQLRNADGIQIVVGMGTCGIAAGARQVMAAVLAEITKRQLQGVTVSQTGCIGMCEQEVLMDVIRPGEPRITYGRVTPETVAIIVADHVVNGRIVEALVVGKLSD